MAGAWVIRGMLVWGVIMMSATVGRAAELPDILDVPMKQASVLPVAIGDPLQELRDTILQQQDLGVVQHFFDWVCRKVPTGADSAGAVGRKPNELGDDQVSAVRRFKVDSGREMGVCARTASKTLIVLPEWEKIKGRPQLGEDAVFKYQEVDDRRLYVRALLSGADTTLHIVGESGATYTFVLRSIRADSAYQPDFTVLVEGDKPLAVATRQTRVEVDKKSVAKVALVSGLKADKADYLDKRDGFELESLDCDQFEVYAATPQGKEILPKSVCRTHSFTYLDFGENANLIRAPGVWLVTDGTTENVDFNWKGTHQQIMVVKTVASLQLGVGQAVVCVIYIGRQKSLGAYNGEH